MQLLAIERRPSLMLRLRVLPWIVVLVLGACTFPGGSPAPAAELAARTVLAEDTRFTGIGARDPELIGQSSWYEVSATADGWQVVVRIGWGDCEAGCIHEHRWTYEVAGDAPRLVSETGDALPDATGITGIATAGPTCPVVHDPPDPACADRPVAGALIIVSESGGGEVTRVSTDEAGQFTVELAPGAYRLEPQPVAGLLGTAAPLEVRVSLDEPMVTVTLAYDTGIR